MPGELLDRSRRRTSHRQVRAERVTQNMYAIMPLVRRHKPDAVANPSWRQRLQSVGGCRRQSRRARTVSSEPSNISELSTWHGLAFDTTKHRRYREAYDAGASHPGPNRGHMAHLAGRGIDRCA